MSRRSNYYDTPIESLWGALKNELVYHQRFATREQARRSDQRIHRDLLLMTAGGLWVPRLPNPTAHHL